MKLEPTEKHLGAIEGLIAHYWYEERDNQMIPAIVQAREMFTLIAPMVLEAAAERLVMAAVREDSDYLTEAADIVRAMKGTT